jgi:hypothetical protein
VGYEQLSSVSEVGVHYTFSIFGLDSWGNAVDPDVISHPIAYLISVCSPALVEGCLRSRSVQNSSGYADVSFRLSQSGIYSISIQGLQSKCSLILCALFCSIISFSVLRTEGLVSGSSNVETCQKLPFDFPMSISRFRHNSLSEVFVNFASDSHPKSLGCVHISAILAAPENSLFSVEMITENAAVYSSVNEQPLQRYRCCDQSNAYANFGLVTFSNRSSFLASGKFAISSQLSKESHSPVVLWISNEQFTPFTMTLSDHRFNEIEHPIDSILYIPSGILSSYTFSVQPGSVCFSQSAAHGDGLSIFEISSNSIFNVITRDEFGNLRTEDIEIVAVSIVYDSLFHPYVMTSSIRSPFREVSVILNNNAASGYCNHLIGALIGMSFYSSVTACSNLLPHLILLRHQIHIFWQLTTAARL